MHGDQKGKARADELSGELQVEREHSHRLAERLRTLGVNPDIWHSFLK